MTAVLGVQFLSEECTLQ